MTKFYHRQFQLFGWRSVVLFCLIFAALALFASAQQSGQNLGNNNVVWATKIGGYGQDYVQKQVLSPIDGSIYLIATIGSPNKTHDLTSPIGYSSMILAKYYPNSTLAWMKQVSGVSSSDYSTVEPQDIAISSDGLVLGVTGGFVGNVSFPGGANIVSSTNAHDLFVAKFDAITGNLLWIRTTYSTDKEDFGSAIALANDGSVFVTGTRNGGAMLYLSLQQNKLACSGYPMILKFNANGAIVWSKLWKYSTVDGILDSTISHISALVLIPSDDSLIITGGFQQQPILDNGYALRSHNVWSFDIFLMKMSQRDGTYLWVKDNLGSVNEDFAYDIAVDTSVNSTGVYLTGSFGGASVYPAEFDGASVAPVGARDIFVAYFEIATGKLLQIRTAGGPGDDYGTAVRVAPDGSGVYVYGNAAPLASIGSTYKNSGQSNTIFLAKYSPTLTTLLWAKSVVQEAANVFPSSSGLSVDATGTFYMSGNSLSAASFGSSNNQVTIDNMGSWDGFLVKFGPCQNCSAGTFSPDGCAADTTQFCYCTGPINITTGPPSTCIHYAPIPVNDLRLGAPPEYHNLTVVWTPLNGQIAYGGVALKQTFFQVADADGNLLAYPTVQQISQDTAVVSSLLQNTTYQISYVVQNVLGLKSTTVLQARTKDIPVVSCPAITFPIVDTNSFSISFPQTGGEVLGYKVRVINAESPSADAVFTFTPAQIAVSGLPLTISSNDLKPGHLFFVQLEATDVYICESVQIVMKPLPINYEWNGWTNSSVIALLYRTSSIGKGVLMNYTINYRTNAYDWKLLDAPEVPDGQDFVLADISPVLPGTTYFFTAQVAVHDSYATRISEPQAEVFSCTATNAVRDIIFSSIEEQSVSVSWSLVAGIDYTDMPPDFFYFTLTDSETKETSFSYLDLWQADPSQFDLTNLKTSHSYQLDIQVRNCYWSYRLVLSPVSTTQFATRPLPPPEPPKDQCRDHTLVFLAHTESSITLTWDPSPAGNVPITFYNVWYSVSNSSSWQVVGSASTSATIQGLLPDTSYDIKVSATNAAGLTSNFTAVLVAVTLPAIPVIVKASRTSATTATLRVQFNTTSSNPAISVRVTPLSSSSIPHTFITDMLGSGGDYAEIQLFNLVPYESYSLEAAMSSAAIAAPGVSQRFSPQSTVFKLGTSLVGASVPSVPQAVSVVNVHAKNFTVKWQQPTSNGNSDILRFEVKVTEIASGQSVVLITNSGSDVSLDVVFGITSNTTYSASVVAVNNVGHSAASQPVTVLTSMLDGTTVKPGQIDHPIHVTNVASSTQQVGSFATVVLVMVALQTVVFALV